VNNGLEELMQEMVVSYFKISERFPGRKEGGKLRKVRVGSRGQESKRKECLSLDREVK
jgi:hypothetical protein